MVRRGLSLVFGILNVFWAISRFLKDFTWAKPCWDMILDRLGLPSRNWHNIPFYFQNRPKRSKSLYLHLFFSHLDIWIVIYQPSMTLFKFNDFSNQCPQLAWGPEDRVTVSRRNEIYETDPSWSKPKNVKHLLTGIIFCQSSSGLGRAEWRVYSVQFADGITEKPPMARGHKMSQVFRSIVYLVKGFQGCRSRLIVKLSRRLR